jgi:hypothetical protein
LEKKCSKCGEIKNVSEYAKMKNSPLGVRPDCKKCKYAQDKEWRDNNMDIVKARRDKRQKALTEIVNKKKEEDLQKIKDKYIGLNLNEYIYITKYVGYIKEYPNSKYTRHFFEKTCKSCDKSANLTPSDIERYIIKGIVCPYCKGSIRKDINGDVEKKCKSCETWLPLNEENFGKSKNRYLGFNYYCKPCKNQKSIKLRENPEKRQREYNQKKQKLKTDPLFKLTCNIRTLIRVSFKNGFTKKSRTEKILGCNYEELKKHFEDRFEPWMTWENYGKYNGDLNFGWDIDHIRPVSLAKNEEELIELNHYTNLQPLCSRVNRYIKRDIENFVYAN